PSAGRAHRRRQGGRGRADPREAAGVEVGKAGHTRPAPRIPETTKRNGHPIMASRCLSDKPRSGAPGALRADLARVAEWLEDADRRLKRAATLADLEEAAAERFEAKEQLHAAGEWLADFGMLLLRYTLHHRRDALRLYLREALRR